MYVIHFDQSAQTKELSYQCKKNNQTLVFSALENHQGNQGFFYIMVKLQLYKILSL
jgi:hypothetical protein